MKANASLTNGGTKRMNATKSGSSMYSGKHYGKRRGNGRKWNPNSLKEGRLTDI
jgi:hypothetical protein